MTSPDPYHAPSPKATPSHTVTVTPGPTPTLPNTGMSTYMHWLGLGLILGGLVLIVLHKANRVINEVLKKKK